MWCPCILGLPATALALDTLPLSFNYFLMLALEEAQNRILNFIRPRPAEAIALDQAHGRWLAAEVLSPMDLPVADNSAMDGYAVRAAEVISASESSPVALTLCGQVAAGAVFAGELRPGGCVRVFTGSVLPAGADAVVMQEDTRMTATDPKVIDFLCAVRPRENVRLGGEDVKRGAVLGQIGDRVTSGRLALLAAVGTTEVAVTRRPVIGLLATGSELVEGGRPLAPGMIYESNRVGLAALATRAGAAPIVYPLVLDTLAATRASLERAFSECDAVVTTGGVSVGELDFVKAAFAEMGGVLDFWRVAIKPGKPFVLGRWREKLLFGLPGNPVSAWVTFLMLVRPALLRWQGAREVALPTMIGRLTEALVNRGDRRHFMRVVLEADGSVCSAGAQASHRLGSLARANGLVDVPPETTLPAGTEVSVVGWEHD